VTQDFLDSLPVAGVILLFVLLALLGYEIGFRIGRWYQRRTPGEQEGPSGVLVGSLLALMAFLLAITMGMATDRFDTRRGLVLAEANAIGTAYLRAGYLPSPQSEQLQELFREYAQQRVSTSDAEQVRAGIQESVRLQNEIWALTEQVAEMRSDDLVALYVESVNDVIDLHETRITAGIYARVPLTVVLLLLIGSVLTLTMVGYNAGLTGRRGLLSALVLVVALGLTLALVVDLDRPQGGLLRVNQQPLIDLQQQIGPPSS